METQETIIKLQLDVPQSFIETLDSAALALARKAKPMSKLEWMHQTKDGRAFMRMILDPNGTSKGKTSEQINKEINDEYRKAVGPAVVGRPKLRIQRLAIIMQAVEEYLKPKAKVMSIRG